MFAIFVRLHAHPRPPPARLFPTILGPKTMRNFQTLTVYFQHCQFWHRPSRSASPQEGCALQRFQEIGKPEGYSQNTGMYHSKLVLLFVNYGFCTRVQIVRAMHSPFREKRGVVLVGGRRGPVVGVIAPPGFSYFLTKFRGIVGAHWLLIL